MNLTHLLLALDDGRKAAAAHGEDGLAAALDAIGETMAQGLQHANDRRWRTDDLQAVFARHGVR